MAHRFRSFGGRSGGASSSGSLSKAPRDYDVNNDDDDDVGSEDAASYNALQQETRWDSTSNNSIDNTTNTYSSSSCCCGIGGGVDGCDEIDPLDAFMQQLRDDGTTKTRAPEKVIYNDDFDGETEASEDFSAQSSSSSATAGNCTNDANGMNKNWKDEDESLDAAKERHHNEKVAIEPLAAVDHSSILYPAFRKDFFSAPSENDPNFRDTASIESFRQSHAVSVVGSGLRSGCLISSFASCPSFNSKLCGEISKAGFVTPTPIQCQAIPIILSGRDVIGLAKTGSGKTLAFMWPLIVHVLDQETPTHGEGPVGLVLVPTRELVVQIYNESKRFCKVLDIDICPIYGGIGKWEMAKALKDSPEIVIATPGRLIDLIRDKATNLRRCTFFVLDEADRMFEMGFEYQMRSIAGNIRPDRQTLMFSATMRRKIEFLAKEILSNPVRVSVGALGQANADIQQNAAIFNNAVEKWTWLASNLDDFVSKGKVLIFVSSKVSTETLTAELRTFFLQRQFAIGVECIHGDKDQGERSSVIRQFSKMNSELSVLVATDVASRGLDIKDVNTVINYEIPKNIETYVHRIGRTGRLGVQGVTPGTAYTLLMQDESSFAVDLVHNLLVSDQSVSPELLNLAQKCPRYSSRCNSYSINNNIGDSSQSSSQMNRHVGGKNNSNNSNNSNLVPQRIGLGLSDARAMTSEMLANKTAGGTATTVATASFFPVSAPPRYGSYGESTPLLPSSSSSGGGSNLSATSMSIYSNLSSLSNTSPYNRSDAQTQSPVIKGFVRASTTTSVLPDQNSAIAGPDSTGAAKKKSRWDN